MIGNIKGIVVGQMFSNRRELHDAGVHRGLQQGIGAGGESIVLSGGYVDDIDEDDLIIYTGEGGRDPNSGRQVADQQLIRGNLALFKHYKEGNPIRVTRGYELDSRYAPARGYRYDGLYRIESCWHEKGKDGYIIWRYRLVRLHKTEQTESVNTQLSVPKGQMQPARSTVYTSRIIRNSEVGNYIKELYGHKCQISGVKLETPAGPYAEACHVKPLGKPHNGPDTPGNVICLSPNMHVLFDLGAIALTDDLQVIGVLTGKLTLHAEHILLVECIRYHREHIYKK